MNLRISSNLRENSLAHFGKIPREASSICCLFLSLSDTIVSYGVQLMWMTRGKVGRTPDEDDGRNRKEKQSVLFFIRIVHPIRGRRAVPCKPSDFLLLLLPLVMVPSRRRRRLAVGGEHGDGVRLLQGGRVQDLNKRVIFLFKILKRSNSFVAN